MLVSTKVSLIKKFYPQWLTGFAVTLVVIQLGILSGWSSPYLARLTRPESTLFLSNEQASWVASLLNLGRFIGAVTGAISVNYLGSKCTLMLSTLPMGCCWIFTMLANSYVWLYAARIIGGFGMGMTYSSFALYVGEVAMPEVRGAIVSFAMGGGGSLGVVLSSVCGSYFTMFQSSIIYVILCLAGGLLLLYLPETPYRLVKIQDFEGAHRAISWYLTGIDAEQELKVVQNLVTSAHREGFFNKLNRLKTGPLRKAIVLIIILFTFMQITGLNSIIFYMEIILTRSKFTLIEPSIIVIWVHVSGICATALAACLIDRFGRRFLLILSCTGVVLAMAGLGSHAYLLNNDENVPNLQWLPIVSVFIFIIFYFVGLMGVPSTVLSEIFPSDIKCVAGCVSSLVGAIWSFAATKSFQPLLDTIGDAYVFWLHGLFALILIPYVSLFMPETKGKTLQEIQNKLNR